MPHRKGFVFGFLGILLNVFLFASPLCAQENDSLQQPDIITQQIETISENSDNELDFTELVEDLNFYQSHPININNSNPEVLRKIPFITDKQVYGIISYVASYGEFLSLYELQAIDGFNIEEIEKILPYITVKNAPKIPPLNFKNLLRFGSNDLLIRYHRTPETSMGYSPASDSVLAANPNARYLGSPDKYYVKYGFSYFDKLRVGITAEKDAGEQFLKGSQKNGFDFYSAFLFAQDIGFVKKIIVGDYQLQFGQGVTMWSGMAFGKSVNGIGFMRNARGIKPFTSTDENNFLRGVATTLEYKNLEMTLFYSSHRVDANIGQYDSLNNETLVVSALQETGYHRTPAELVDKHAISKTFYGAHVTYKNVWFKGGLSYYESKLGAELSLSTSPYNQYDFSGKFNRNLGADYIFMNSRFNFYGELGMSMNGAIGMLNGVNLLFHPSVQIGILHRYYQKNYQSLLGNSFADNSTNQNENGWIINLKTQLNKHLSFAGYADYYSFPWLKYRTDAPSSGKEYAAQFTYSPSMKTEIYFRYRYTQNQINHPAEGAYLNYLDNQYRQNFRIHVSHNLSSKISLKSRVEYLAYQQQSQKQYNGFLIYQDVSYTFQKPHIVLSARYAIFDTDSYDARLYANESNVLYAFSIPALYNKGSRYYLLVHYKINRTLECWVRFAQTNYINTQIISSGLDQINGNLKSEITAQLRVKF